MNALAVLRFSRSCFEELDSMFSAYSFCTPFKKVDNKKSRVKNPA